MKGIIVLAFLLTAGCSAYVPLEQLEAEALVTGDWSRVEQRQRILERRKLRSYMACPPGTIGYCETSNTGPRCSCIDSAIVNSYLGN